MCRLFRLAGDAAAPDAESFLSLIHPDDRSAMQGWMAACAAGEQPDGLEFRINMPDGTIRYLLGRGAAIHDAEGGFVRMLSYTPEEFRHPRCFGASAGRSPAREARRRFAGSPAQREVAERPVADLCQLQEDPR
jgi:hypothetical protein